MMFYVFTCMCCVFSPFSLQRRNDENKPCKSRYDVTRLWKDTCVNL